MGTLLLKGSAGRGVARGKRVTQKEREDFERQGTKCYRIIKVYNLNTKKYRLHLETWRPLVTFNESHFLRAMRTQAMALGKQGGVASAPKLDGEVRRVKRELLEHPQKSCVRG